MYCDHEKLSPIQKVDRYAKSPLNINEIDNKPIYRKKTGDNKEYMSKTTPGQILELRNAHKVNMRERIKMETCAATRSDENLI